MTKNYGPNVTKLITRFIAREAIPPGGGIAAGLEFFQNPVLRKQVLEIAEAKALEAIFLVQSAPDNPYKTDEEIAKVLLDKLEERKRK